jgi:hypothetical protein
LQAIAIYMEAVVETLLKELEKQSEKKIGLIPIKTYLMSMNKQYLLSLAENLHIEGINEQTGQEYLIHKLFLHYHSEFKKSPENEKKYGSLLEFIGLQIFGHLTTQQNWKSRLDVEQDLDFFSKSELISIFADYCADLGITTYDVRKNKDFDFDLFLTKRDPILKTEAVFIKPGWELEKIFGDAFIEQVAKASKYCDWTLLVTTPYAILKIGLQRLIDYMEYLKIWLYVVDPYQKRVLGITKGKKSKDLDESLQNKLTSQLPEQSYRSPSQLGKISKYYFSERESYKPNNFQYFSLNNLQPIAENRESLYANTFRTAVIIANPSGLKMFSIANNAFPVDDSLVSAFFSAMDSFVKEIAGTGVLEEINYKNFYVYGTAGENVKVIIFMSEPAKENLKDRLSFVKDQFEEIYQQQILVFMKNGNISLFDQDDVSLLLKKVLSI